MFHQILSVPTRGLGLYEITPAVNEVVKASQIIDGMCNVFIIHTSASLCIQENADHTAKDDLESFMTRFVPYEKWFSHKAEGRDDMTAHIKAALTDVSINIPVLGGKLALGVWQGIYVWEHRELHQRRNVTVTIWK